MASTWRRRRSPSPDVVDDVDERPIRGRSSDRRRQGEGRRLRRMRDEYGQGPKRAVAEAVARLLKIQPGIQNTLESSPPKGRLLGQMQLYKLRPLPGATAVSAVGEDDAVVPRWMVEGCNRQRRRLL
jgi:hypothetical protein